VADLEVVRGVVGRRGVEAAGLGRHHVRKEGVGLRAVHSHLDMDMEMVQNGLLSLKTGQNNLNERCLSVPPCDASKST
jgi:hypothetical protein